MSLTTVLLSDVAITMALFVGTVLYIQKYLRALLIELCGTAQRASFWLAFSNVTLVLVPLIFALDYKPEVGPDRNFIFEMATQLKHAIIGFVLAFGALAAILFRFIPRGKGSTPAVSPN